MSLHALVVYPFVCFLLCYVVYKVFVYYKTATTDRLVSLFLDTCTHFFWVYHLGVELLSQRVAINFLRWCN